MNKIKIEKLTDSQIKDKGINTWPIWEKEISRFDYIYDENEECLFLEGDVIIETSDGNYNIKPGDFVTFMDGLKCVWDIKKPVKKHYNFY